MNEAEKFFQEKADEKKLRLFDLKMAPEMGGDFKSRGFTFSKDGLFAGIG